MPNPDFYPALPYLSAHLPGTGGVIRQETEDFSVEEIPLYLPSGVGEHIYCWIEKRNLTTRAALEIISAGTGCPMESIGVAGLKDKFAVSQQWISLPARYGARLAPGELAPGLYLWETRRHSNKLGVGHLLGNRFQVRVREAPGTVAQAAAILSFLAPLGVPNYFGPQRFGLQGQNPAKGYQLLANSKGRGKPWLKRFLIGSVQSLFFNAWIAERIREDLFVNLMVGDVAKKHTTGGIFTVEDPASENPRAQAFEISATGPLFGRKYFRSQGPAQELEERVLAQMGLTPEQFNARHGARRFIRFPLGQVNLEATDDGYRLDFSLPKGSYATSLLREVMKNIPDHQ